MIKNLKKYARFVSERQINEIYEKASKLSGKHILNINSTYQGGGVAEILNSLIPLMNEIGMDVGWRILHGSPDFFTTTKKFYSALQGEQIHFTKAKQQLYTEVNKKFSTFTHIHHDAVIVHDVQPLPLINFYKKRQPWIWRCHTDISSPNRQVLNYLKKFINNYDLAVVLSKRFIRPEFKIPQVVMPPSIDPLSTKNTELSERVMEKYLRKFNIPTDRPLLCQVSRFDRFKDHEGVIKIFREVRKKIPCRLVLIGSFALDDPTSPKIYESLSRKASGDKDIILINTTNDILVNTLQRKASVIYQKSFREGFGLTVAEAMWKGTPVIASKVGGIQDQIVNGKNGFLLDPYDIKGFAAATLKLLKDKKLRRKITTRGKETVRSKFLITSHLLSWINTLIDIFEKEAKKR